MTLRYVRVENWIIHQRVKEKRTVAQHLIHFSYNFEWSDAAARRCKYLFAIIYQELCVPMCVRVHTHICVRVCITADACGSERRRPPPLIRGRLSIYLPQFRLASRPRPAPRSLFNYYGPRSLRHFQGVLTITDGTGGPHESSQTFARGAATPTHRGNIVFHPCLPASLSCIADVFPRRLLRYAFERNGNALPARARNLIPPLSSLLRPAAIYSHARVDCNESSLAQTQKRSTMNLISYDRYRYVACHDCVNSSDSSLFFFFFLYSHR